jgi:hypothetical protein
VCFDDRAYIGLAIKDMGRDTLSYQVHLGAWQLKLTLLERSRLGRLDLREADGEC